MELAGNEVRNEGGAIRWVGASNVPFLDHSLIVVKGLV